MGGRVYQNDDTHAEEGLGVLEQPQTHPILSYQSSFAWPCEERYAQTLNIHRSFWPTDSALPTNANSGMAVPPVSESASLAEWKCRSRVEHTIRSHEHDMDDGRVWML